MAVAQPEGSLSSRSLISSRVKASWTIFFVAGVCGDSEMIARVAVDDFGILCPGEGRADEYEVLPAGGVADVLAALDDECFEVRFGDGVNRLVGPLS